MYYVYELIDVRTKLPFYVGKGTVGNNRHLDHFSETEETTENRHKFYKIQYLKNKGFDIPVRIIATDIDSEIVAYNLEEEYIRKYGRENLDPNGILTNICIDRRPPSHKGKKKSAEHVAKIVASCKKTFEKFGRPEVNAVTKKRLSEKQLGSKNQFYGKHHTAESKKLISTKNKGNKSRPKTFIFTSPINEKFTVIGEFHKFCKDHNLSVGTMEKVLRTGNCTSYGKCAGWLVSTEIK